MSVICSCLDNGSKMLEKAKQSKAMESINDDTGVATLHFFSFTLISSTHHVTLKVFVFFFAFVQKDIFLNKLKRVLKQRQKGTKRHYHTCTFFSVRKSVVKQNRILLRLIATEQ